MESYEETGFKKKVRHQKVYECDEFGISGVFEIIGEAENKIGTTGGGCGWLRNLIVDFSTGIQRTCNLAEQGILAAQSSVNGLILCDGNADVGIEFCEILIS